MERACKQRHQNERDDRTGESHGYNRLSVVLWLLQEARKMIFVRYSTFEQFFDLKLN